MTVKHQYTWDIYPNEPDGLSGILAISIAKKHSYPYSILVAINRKGRRALDVRFIINTYIENYMRI